MGARRTLDVQRHRSCLPSIRVYTTYPCLNFLPMMTVTVGVCKDPENEDVAGAPVAIDVALVVTLIAAGLVFAQALMLPLFSPLNVIVRLPTLPRAVRQRSRFCDP